MTAKELGQIHTVKDNSNITIGDQGTDGTCRIDLAGLLTAQTQRMVRQGNYFKLVGIDISVTPNVTGPADGASISGYFRYYTPTKGRCAAYRHAFKAMADQMTMQGVPMRENKLYDFRVALTNSSTLQNVLKNQATLDGTNGLCLKDSASVPAPGASVFGVYNKSVIPNTTAMAPADLFDEGFDTLLQSGAGKTDFVLNEADIYSGNEDFADLTFSEIPFSVAFAPGARTLSFQWRPDPALYVAVLTGNLEMVIEDVDLDGAATSASVDANFQVSGWKSIMSNPDTKKRSRSKRKGRK